MDAGNLNKNKKHQDEKEDSEPEDVEQGQEKINEQIDEVMNLWWCFIS